MRMSLHSAASGSDRSKLGIAFTTGAIGNEAGNIDTGRSLPDPAFTCSSSQSDDRREICLIGGWQECGRFSPRRANGLRTRFPQRGVRPLVRALRRLAARRSRLRNLRPPVSVPRRTNHRPMITTPNARSAVLKGPGHCCKKSAGIKRSVRPCYRRSGDSWPEDSLPMAGQA